MSYDIARASADEYRRFWGKEGGYVCVFWNSATCWRPDLPPAGEWYPGTLAVGADGQIYKAVGTSPNGSAEHWRKVHE